MHEVQNYGRSTECFSRESCMDGNGRERALEESNINWAWWHTSALTAAWGAETSGWESRGCGDQLGGPA